MATLPLDLRQDTGFASPFRTGLAFATTVGLFYGLCTLVWLAAPGPFMSFMNSLFHGLDFTTMQKAGSFALSGFLGALAVLAVWAFMAGTFFGWLRSRLG